MDKKDGWMYVSFIVLLICAGLGFLQGRCTSENNYRKRFDELNKASVESARVKVKYDELKKSYLELAQTQSKILEKMMLKTKILKENNPDYESLGKDELDKRVRRDIGRLEVRIDELEKER